ncbi:MAG: histidinol dehydrogenase [Actinobacteria bacterium]|nr:histidinol dehydrogenase [Actinomycetota bacterium]
MLRRTDLRGSGAIDPALLTRPAAAESDDDALATVRDIIADVRARGDAAVRELTARYDGCTTGDLRVPPEDRLRALHSLPADLREALEFARDQIAAYHGLQDAPDVTMRRAGIEVHELVRPVDRAGLYAPGGRAPLASTVLMTAVPARIAGVPEVVLCVPPGLDGRVPDVMLAASALADVDQVYAVGGAQAIAAMAYGTATIPRVDVIVGPGNRYVALAKREVAGVVGIESTAGPSELVVLADDAAPPDFVAVDLMAQAEHGPDGAAVLVTWSQDVADAVDAALARLLEAAPRRKEIDSTLARGGRTILVDDARTAVEVANAIAPEHLELMTAEPAKLLADVRNAGAVFCGVWAPAVIGDYVAGANHVLPTARTARYASALRVDDFRKHIHVVDVDEPALRGVAARVTTLADMEGLDAHAQTIAIRTAAR